MGMDKDRNGDRDGDEEEQHYKSVLLNLPTGETIEYSSSCGEPQP